MTRLSQVFILGAALAALPGFAQAQTVINSPTTAYRVNDYVGLPNLYGTSWGVASYGIPQTYSTFASPYGAGYSFGHQGSYGVLPGPWGVGLWRPGIVTPGYVYGSAYGYNTFPYPYKPGGPRYGPSIGVYAPSYGPTQPSPYYRP